MVKSRFSCKQLSNLWARRSTRPYRQSGSTTFVHSGNCCAAASRIHASSQCASRSQINQPFLLVYWDYSIRNCGCQESFLSFFPKAAICFPNVPCLHQKVPAAPIGTAGTLFQNIRGLSPAPFQPLAASMALTSANVQPGPVRSAVITGFTGTARYMLLP